MIKKNYPVRFSLLLFLLFYVVMLTAQSKKLPAIKKNENNDKEKLLALEYNWLKAEFARDTAFLSTLMDNSFMSISANGISNKQEELLFYYKNISQRLQDSIFIDSFRLENPVINIYDNTAVVTFVVHTFRKEKGVAAELKTRFYDVWIKRNSKWKAVASQGTKVLE